MAWRRYRGPACPFLKIKKKFLYGRTRCIVHYTACKIIIELMSATDTGIEELVHRIWYVYCIYDHIC